MKQHFVALNLFTAIALAACGGGGYGGGSTGGAYGGPVPPRPTPRPTASSTPAPGGVLATHAIDGGQAFVNAAGFAVYVSDADTQANVSTCIGQCSAEWPPVAPPAGALPSPWAAFGRPDNSQQLSYKGKPLYTFAGDTQRYVASGNGLAGFHIARP